MPRLPPVLMDQIDFELCLDVDQHESVPHQPDDVNVTGTDANDQQGPLTLRLRRTRTFTEIEDDSTDRSDHGANNRPKRPRVLGFGDDTRPIYTLQGGRHSGGDDLPEYQCQTIAVGSFFSHHEDDTPVMINPLHTTMSPDNSEIFSVPMDMDTAPYQDTTYSELETGRSSFSSMHRPCSIEGNITSFSSTASHPSNRFTIFEDPDDVMEFATSHIEFSHTWPSYASCVEDNKENYEGDEDADDEAENPNAGSTPYASNLPHARGYPIDRATAIFPNSSSAMEPVRSIQDDEHAHEHHPDYAQSQETPMNTYHDQPFRHLWGSEAEGVVLLPASPPRHSHLSVPDNFDADDEADQGFTLTNSGYDNSMNTHYQDEMGYFYRPFPTLAEAPELSTVYSPLTEIPSMSPICPEIVTQGPRRSRRPRVRFPVV